MVPNEGSCRVLCYMEPNCVSINVGPLEGGRYKCELNNATDENQFTSFLEKRDTFTFLAIENPCSSNPCVNNGTCQAGYTSQGFRCICPAGFTGTYCPADIDECITNSHDCHVNASCINTVGSHICFCNQGFTGDGRQCSDFTSDLKRFKKHQDLQTKSAQDCEQFSVDGSLFLAFANYFGNSYIYKLNESNGKFFLHQSINTRKAYDMEYFRINNKHYLAVVSDGNKVESPIFQWNGSQFVIFQKVSSNYARSLRFFKTFGDQEERYLVVTRDRSDAVIFKWKDSRFEMFQKVSEAKGGRESTVFAINNDIFIAFAIYYASPVFKWSSESENFVKLQTLSTRGTGVQFFVVNSDTFLAFSCVDNGDFLYKWNGTQFVVSQTIPASGARTYHSFVMCGQTYLGEGSYRKTVVYKYSAEQFIIYQEFANRGTTSITSFEHKGHSYLVTAKRWYNSYSTVYKWT